jgi:hypothetical protein
VHNLVVDSNDVVGREHGCGQICPENRLSEFSEREIGRIDRRKSGEAISASQHNKVRWVQFKYRPIRLGLNPGAPEGDDDGIDFIMVSIAEIARAGSLRERQDNTDIIQEDSSERDPEDEWPGRHREHHP